MPIFVSYLSGIKPSEIEKGNSHRMKVFLNAVAFIIGFSIIFIILVIKIVAVSESIPEFRTWLSRIGGIVIIALGLQTLELINIPFLSVARSVKVKRTEPSYAGSVVIGGAFAVGWTPCVSGILASIFVLASISASAFDGAFLLATYSAGFAIPFLALGYFTSQATRLIHKYQRYMSIVNLVSGVLLIALGIIIFTERFQELVSFLI